MQTPTSSGEEKRSLWQEKSRERRPSLSAKWIIDIPFFPPSRSTFGRNTITNPIRITITIHGGAFHMGGDSDSITTVTVVNLLKSSRKDFGKRETPHPLQPNGLTDSPWSVIN